jgi:hypothetical protein
VCIGLVEASCPSPAVQLVVVAVCIAVGAVVGIVVGIVEASRLDSYPYSCLHPSHPSHFRASELPEVWLFVVAEWAVASVDSPASPVDRASQDLPYDLPYCLHHTVGLPFQACGASGFAVAEADVVAERGPSPFRRPLVQHRSFRGIMTGGGHPRASSYHYSQVYPYLAGYETPLAGLVLATDTVEGRCSAAGVPDALTPDALLSQASPPQLQALVALPEVWGQNKRVNRSRLDAWI